MATKKRAKKQAGKKPKAKDIALPDVRGMEGLMAGMFPRPDDPVEQAQEIMYDAWESEDPKRRVALARRVSTPIWKSPEVAGVNMACSWVASSSSLL